MQEEDFFQKEFAKDLKKREKEREAYIQMAQDAKRKREAQEEAKSMSGNEIGNLKHFEIEDDKKAKTKQAKPLNKLSTS